jgi:hypothetical protein
VLVGAPPLTIEGNGWSLPATLELPEGAKAVPCIVFFAGSGPTDRDWLSPFLPGIHASRTAVAKQTDRRLGGLISMSGPSRTILETAIGQLRVQALARGGSPRAVDAGLLGFGAAVAKDGAAPDLSAIPEAAPLWQVMADPRQAKVARELLLADPLESIRAWNGPLRATGAPSKAAGAVCGE